MNNHDHIRKSIEDHNDVADISLIIPSDSTARIQESHILICHIFCELIEKELGFE